MVEVYRIVDIHTGLFVGGEHRTLRSALRSAERRNLAYGAHRFTHRKVMRM